MQISTILTPGRMLTTQAGSKRRAFEQLSILLAKDQPSLNEEEIYSQLLERERLGSTGLGNGIALPHARISALTNTSAAFIQLEQAIDFDAIDNQPVDILFALLVPELSQEEQTTHLQMLASLAAMFSDPGFCMDLRQGGLTDKYRLMERWHKIKQAA